MIQRQGTIIDVNDCSRCGGRHTKMRALPLHRPSTYKSAVEHVDKTYKFTHHSVCPNTLEPVMIGLVQE